MLAPGDFRSNLTCINMKTSHGNKFDSEYKINELTVQLMLSYGAQGNCPTTHLPHPTCFEAQGLKVCPN